jgi:two-component system CheB/CheR fusion protein
MGRRLLDGEEAYSHRDGASGVLEQLCREPGIQIFGTDASDRSIGESENGSIPGKHRGRSVAERLRRFFVKVDGGYQVSKRVRDCASSHVRTCATIRRFHGST